MRHSLPSPQAYFKLGARATSPAQRRRYRQTVEAVRCAGDVVCPKSEVDPSPQDSWKPWQTCCTMKSIEHEQNWSRLELAIVLVVAKTNRYVDVTPLIPAIESALDVCKPGQLLRVGPNCVM